MKTYGVLQLKSMLDKKKKYITCANCGSVGHMFRNCVNPITSFGLIAFCQGKLKQGPVLDIPCYKCKDHFKKTDTLEKNNNSCTKDKQLLYLLVQRKDTMGFIDFVRGKYPDTPIEQTELINIYLGEMTCEERNKLITQDFDTIWDNMWINHSSKCYINEYNKAEKRFSLLDKEKLISQSKCNWTETEWGFPKGRKNMKEDNYHCAVREFSEETGYKYKRI